MNDKRISTGIEGLDEKMRGGFLENSVNLITGKTGTGKTALCASFIKKGAEEGQNGVYVTTEESEEGIIKDMESMFSWNFKKLQDKEKLKMITLKPIFPSESIEELNKLARNYISNFLRELKESVKELEAERVVIDSVSLIEMFVQNEYIARVALSSLIDTLKDLEATTIVVGTLPESSRGLTDEGIAEYLVDSIIKMEFLPVVEEYDRTLTIRKMRRTDHSTDIHPFKITPDGLKVVEIR
ncbi:MAG: RAD55 family ATPase [Candidatus Aenigmatarchaeota archaeon]